MASIGCSETTIRMGHQIRYWWSIRAPAHFRLGLVELSLALGVL